MSQREDLCISLMIFMFISLSRVCRFISEKHSLLNLLCEIEFRMFTSERKPFFSLTSLTSKLVTITALHVVPFIFVFHTKSVHTILLFIVIWLILGPSCKVSFSSIHQVKFPSTDLPFKPSHGISAL